MTAPAIVQPDNVALVTGAALGIGRAMCRRFAGAGMSIVVADLPEEELDRTVDALKAISPRGPDGILKAPTDVADPEQVQRLRDTVMARFGKVNLLANNAATRIGRGHEAALADWRRAMDVNLWGANSRGARISARHAGVHGGRRDRQCWLQAGDHQSPGHPVYNMTPAPRSRDASGTRVGGFRSCRRGERDARRSATVNAAASAVLAPWSDCTRDPPPLGT